MKILSCLLCASAFLTYCSLASADWKLEGPVPDPWVSCEFMLIKPHENASATKNFARMAKLKPYLRTFHNEEATDKAYGAFGIPKAKNLSLEMRKEKGLWKTVVLDGDEILASLVIHFPPILVWKDVPLQEFEPTLEFSLGTEDLHKIAIGQVYESRGIRKYVSYTLGRHSEDVKLWVGIDVPCENLQEYSPQLPQYIIVNENKVFCRVDLLSTWVK